MTDIEMLPIPQDWEGVQLVPNSLIQNYARAVAEHNVRLRGGIDPLAVLIRAQEAEARAEALRAEVAAVWNAMPSGTCYLDPPDGGDVPLHEQVLRMAADAARAERLAEALRPLAGLDLRPDGFDKRDDSQPVYARDKSEITVGDVRRAVAALRDHDQEGGE